MRKRSPFNLSHYHLTTMNPGQLIPISWFETLPFDTIQHQAQAFIRCQQLLAPLMHPVSVSIDHWYVPLNLLWDEFETFITGGDDGLQTPVHPYFGITGVTQGTLQNYMGLPVGTYNVWANALPFRAYNLIWNTHYRDKDLQTELGISTSSGSDSGISVDVKNVCWEKDYITTCRPWEQKGTEVTIPLAADAPVSGIGVKNGTSFGTGQTAKETDGTGTETYTAALGTWATDSMVVEEDTSNTGYPNIRADLTSSTGIEISDLRLALAKQRFQERMGKSGSDYYEYLQALGMKPLDNRYRQPEFLGGNRAPIEFAEIMATDGTNTGQLYGAGAGAMRTNRYRFFSHEHGIVMSLMYIRPKALYTDAINRKFLRTTKEMYFQKEYEFTGDQAVQNREVYAEHTNPDSTFGFQTRYDEYRSIPSYASGEFVDATMDHWHLGRMHTADVALNSSYVTCNPATRPYGAPSTDSMYCYVKHNIQARRAMRRIPGAKTF